MAIWKEYFENAYISCFHYLVNKKLHWSERLFWFITLIICVCSTCIIIIRSTIEYNSQKPTFRVDTNYLDWNSPFPSVVVCELVSTSPRVSAIKKKLFSEYAKTPSDSQYINLMASASDMAFHRPPTFGETKYSCDRYPHTCLKGNFSYYMNQIRGNCTDLLTKCQYNGFVFKCEEEFLPVATPFGKCFAFNNFGARVNGSRLRQPKWMITRQPNKKEGELIIEIKHPDIAISVLGPYGVPTTKNLYLIRENTRASSILPSITYRYFYKTEQIVTLENERSVPIEDRECRFPEESNLEHFDMYTEANCEIECFIKAQKKACKCAAHSTPVIKPSEECDLAGLLCTHENTEITKYMSDECDCLPNCNSTNLEKIGEYETRDTDKKIYLDTATFARVIISVPAPTLRYIRFTFKSTLDIIVSIGGTISFFLGFSFLSIAQILYYLFMRSVTDQYRLQRKRKTQEKERNVNDTFRTNMMKLRLVGIEKNIRTDIKKKIANTK